MVRLVLAVILLLSTALPSTGTADHLCEEGEPPSGRYADFRVDRVFDHYCGTQLLLPAETEGDYLRGCEWSVDPEEGTVFGAGICPHVEGVDSDTFRWTYHIAVVGEATLLDAFIRDRETREVLHDCFDEQDCTITHGLFVSYLHISGTSEIECDGEPREIGGSAHLTTGWQSIHVNNYGVATMCT